MSNFSTVDAITRLAEEHGWPPRQAFELAMFLTLHGTTASEARQLLADAQRRVQ